MTIVGVATLNPILAGSGFVVAVGGGVTSIAGAWIKHGWNKQKQKELKDMIERDNQLSREITNKVCAISDEVARLSKNKQLTRYVAQLSLITGKRMFDAVNTPIRLANTVEIVNLLKSLNAPNMEAQISGYLVSDGKLFGLALFEAGSAAARVLETLGGVLNIAFGIFDVIFGVKNLENGSEMADKVDDIRRDLQNTKQEIINAYNGVNDFLR